MAKYSLIVWESKEATLVYLVRNRRINERQRRILRMANGTYINGFAHHMRAVAVRRLDELLKSEWKRYRLLRSDYKECAEFAQSFDCIFERYKITRVWLSGVLLGKKEAEELKKLRAAERKELEKLEKSTKLASLRILRDRIREYVSTKTGPSEALCSGTEDDS